MAKLLQVQRKDGAGMHQFYPLTMEATIGDAAEGVDRPDYYGDDHLWLVLAVTAYVKETGDLAFLDEVLPYYEKDADGVPQSTGTVLNHLQRALAFTWLHTGAHGLPLLGFADWNDTMNLRKGAESLFNAHLFGTALREMIALADHLGDTRLAATCREQYADDARPGQRPGVGRRPRRRHVVRALLRQRRQPHRLGAERQGPDLPQRPVVGRPLGLRDARAGAPGARRRPRAAGHRQRAQGRHAGLRRLRPRQGRDHDLPAGHQGELRHFSPHQPVDDDRRDDGGPRRPRLRVLRADQPGGAQRPHRRVRGRALRLLPEHPQRRAPAVRAGAQQLAHGHRLVGLPGGHPVDPRHPARPTKGWRSTRASRRRGTASALAASSAAPPTRSPSPTPTTSARASAG